LKPLLVSTFDKEDKVQNLAVSKIQTKDFDQFTQNTLVLSKLNDQSQPNAIIGCSPKMKAVFDLVEKVADCDSTILITGETGTGKGLVAKAIHQNSKRKNKPFISINCGAIPENLLESELFGHVKGSFTGAALDHKGIIEEANGGTLFMDEINNLPLEMQSKFLRFLQEGEVRPLGSNRVNKVDVRVISASSIPLNELVEKKEFREDLFYRLNVIKIELPPLRDRKEDIPLLVKHFLEIYSEENKKEIMGVSEDVMEILENYNWPGNIRELENLIERAVVLTKSKIITRNNLPPFLLETKSIEVIPPSLSNNLHLKERVQSYQRKAIVEALKRTKGVQKKAARLLGVKPTTLNEMIKRLNIDADHIFYN